ncbi:MAG: hypothetical protein HY675_12060 [Chloroflexi bacterium]|nr:hypothetical protein [Chloroflexota bacterium]
MGLILEDDARGGEATFGFGLRAALRVEQKAYAANSAPGPASSAAFRVEL